MSQVNVSDGILCTGLDCLLQRIVALEQTEREHYQLQEKYIHSLSRVASLEQRNAELESRLAALQQQQTLLQGFVEHSPALVYVKDMHGHYVLVNHRTAAKLQRDTNAIIGKRDEDLFTSPVAAILRDHDCQVLATGKPLEVEEIVPHDDGLATYMSVKFPIYDTNGVIYATGGISTDITERKRMEKVLRASEERFRTVADFTHDWEYWIDPHGNLAYVSPSCERITGYPPEAFQRNPMLMEAILHPSDRVRVASHLYSAVRREGVISTEFRILSKNGEERWISHVCQPVYNSDGHWVGRRASNRDITDRVRVEEAYRAVVTHSMQAFIIFQDERVVFANPAAAHITGYTIDELLSLTTPEAHAIIYSEDRAMMVVRDQDLIAGKAIPTQYTFRILRKDGDVRWVEAFSTLIAYRGQPAVQMAYIDITERRRAEEALHQSQRLLEKTFAALHDAVFTLDADTRIIACNPAASEIFGYTPQEMLGQTIALLHVDAHALSEFHKELFRAVQEPGYLLLPEFPMRREDGTCFPAEHSVMPLIDEQGKYIGWVSVVRDITERKDAERALRESEARYRLMADHATDMISRHSLDGTYRYVSPACYAILGYQPEELVGRNSYNFFHPDDLDAIRQSHTTILNVADAYVVSYRKRHKDGHYVWLETTSRTIQDVQRGSVVEIVAISRDITERKRIETELEQSLALLQATFDSTADGIIVTTPEQGIISHNHKFRQMWQLSGSCPTLSANVEQYMSVMAKQVKDPDAFLRRIEDIGHTPEAETYDILELHDGRIFEYYSTPYQAGSISAGRVWSFRDVTDRKRAEAELHASRARLQAMFDNAAVGIVLLDASGNVINANNRTADMLRCSVDNVTRLNFLDVTHPEDIETSYDRIQSLINGKTDNCRIERRIVRQDGSMFWGDVAITAIRDTAGILDAIIGVVIDITERKEAEALIQQVNEQLKYQAICDPLTGLFNRRYLDETLRRELQRAARQCHPLAVVLLDIDHFKHVNDTYGHDAGDVVLQAVAEVLQSRTRSNDIVCRYGGEEFVLILPGASLEDTWRRAEELRTRIKYLVVKHYDQSLETVTISAGIAVFPMHAASDEEMVKAADTALYRAKANGRDCVVVAESNSTRRRKPNRRPW